MTIPVIKVAIILFITGALSNGRHDTLSITQPRSAVPIMLKRKANP
jgi:hypothetical protein